VPWLLFLAVALALFGPAWYLLGPDGVADPGGYVPVGLFLVLLPTPLFPIALSCLPQYLAYFVPTYIMIRIVAAAYRSRSRLWGR